MKKSCNKIYSRIWRLNWTMFCSYLLHTQREGATHHFTLVTGIVIDRQEETEEVAVCIYSETVSDAFISFFQ